MSDELAPGMHLALRENTYDFINAAILEAQVAEDDPVHWKFGSSTWRPRWSSSSRHGSPGSTSCLSGSRRSEWIGLADDRVEDAVQALVLVRNVLVERHRHDAEFLRKPPHADRVDAGVVREHDGGAHYPPLGDGPATGRFSGVVLNLLCRARSHELFAVFARVPV
jgi:hypothetical protein